jgi:hypothetical protein
MSRSAKRAKQLASIRDLRGLCEQVAEARAVRSARAAYDQEVKCRQDAELLATALDDWRSVLAEPRFDPMKASLHRRSVERLDQTRAASSEESAVLSRQLEEAQREFSLARAGHRCADELLNRAQHRHARSRDEKILAASDDRNAGRMGAR